MVATIAFGMGINKPDVRFVAHMSIPKNIEAYYQETGRAGRDGLPAQALMFYGQGDAAMQRSFIEDSNAPDIQKRIEHQKLNALLGLCETASCRRQVVLEYFGDQATPCGNCDTCLTPRETFDATIAVQKALSAVYRTGQRFGVSYLIDLLLGKDSDRIKQFGHDKLPLMGIGKEHDKNGWQSIFRQLVAQNMLGVDTAAHGGLYLTEKGQRFLKEKETLQLCKPAERTRRERIKAVAASMAVAIENDADQNLFTALKAARLALAKAQNIPPYVIFHDKTLQELARLKPASFEEMLTISGVGEQKIKRYGELFLGIIAQHCLPA